MDICTYHYTYNTISDLVVSTTLLMLSFTPLVHKRVQTPVAENVIQLSRESRALFASSASRRLHHANHFSCNFQFKAKSNFQHSYLHQFYLLLYTIDDICFKSRAFPALSSPLCRMAPFTLQLTHKENVFEVGCHF